MLSLLIVLGVVLVPALAAEPLSLCTVLQRLSEYANKRISVRTHVVLSREGVFFQDEACMEGPKTGDYSWPPLVSWAAPGNRESIPSDYRLNAQSISKFEVEVNRARSRDVRLEIVATVTGILRTEANPKFVRTRSGALKPLGFGHLGEFPAEILIEDISEWVIRDTQKR